MKIAFDESGNTGPNLLDIEQRFFALSSVRFTVEEQNELAGIFDSKTTELHFVKLRRRYDQKIIEFLNHELITNSRIKYSLAEKKFELICRLVDNLIEPVFHEMGINLYQDGSHLATSNMIYIFSVTDNIKEGVDELLRLFQVMMRAKTVIAIRSFYLHLDNITTGILANPIFFALQMSKTHVVSMIRDSGKYNIDPTYPAFTAVVNHWYYELNSRIDIVHDESKQVEYWRELIDFLSDENIHEQVEHRIITGIKSVFPIPVNSVEMVDSENSLSVQLADLIGSSLTYALNKQANNEENDLSKAVLESKVNGLPDCHYLFPTFAVTPEDLGTKGTKNDETLNHLTNVITDHSEKYDEINDRLD